LHELDIASLDEFEDCEEQTDHGALAAQLIEQASCVQAFRTASLSELVLEILDHLRNTDIFTANFVRRTAFSTRENRLERAHQIMNAYG